MRRLCVGLSALALAALGACGGDEAQPVQEPVQSIENDGEAGPASEPAIDAAHDNAPETDIASQPAVLAAAGAPGFAVIYPGGVVQAPGDETVATNGPGGLVSYVTTASPDAVVAFHRARAEEEGLASVMAMNQGDARAYGAHSTNTGANLSVFAKPGEGGGAAVQLIWSAGG